MNREQSIQTAESYFSVVIGEIETVITDKKSAIFLTLSNSNTGFINEL